MRHANYSVDKQTISIRHTVHFMLFYSVNRWENVDYNSEQKKIGKLKIHMIAFRRNKPNVAEAGHKSGTKYRARYRLSIKRGSRILL